LNILVLADRFIRRELVETIITDKLGHDNELKIDSCSFNWPLSPFISNEEVRE